MVSEGGRINESSVLYHRIADPPVGGGGNTHVCVCVCVCVCVLSRRC